MKNRLIKLALLMTLIFSCPALSTPAHALSAMDWLVEPYVGYNLFGGTSFAGGTYNTVPYGTYTGTNFGARAGIELIDILFVELDGSYSPSLFLKTSTAGQNLNLLATAPAMAEGASNIKLGIVAGVRVPLIGMRAWVGYNFLDQMRGTSSTLLNGYSIKVGASIPVLFFLSINAEWINSVYGSYTPQGGSSTRNGGGTISNSNILVSISAPFSL